MKFSASRLFYVFILLFLFVCCSEDEEPQGELITDITGTVSTQAFCNTDDNGLSLRIDLDNFDDVDFIVVGNLAQEFKVDGLRIHFDMRQSGEGISFCQDVVSSNMFFQVFNVSSFTE